MASLSIHDEGSGIPPEVRDKIFDLYFTTKKDGSGIGLAMTYRIVELHNGSIAVESDATHGTTFILRFPLSNLQESRARGYFMPDRSSPSGSVIAKEPT
jgi:signal transduction histidine kinase